MLWYSMHAMVLASTNIASWVFKLLDQVLWTNSSLSYSIITWMNDRIISQGCCYVSMHLIIEFLLPTRPKLLLQLIALRAILELLLVWWIHHFVLGLLDIMKVCQVCDHLFLGIGLLKVHLERRFPLLPILTCVDACRWIRNKNWVFMHKFLRWIGLTYFFWVKFLISKESCLNFLLWLRIFTTLISIDL